MIWTTYFSRMRILTWKYILTFKKHCKAQGQGHYGVKCLRQDQCQCQCPSWGHGQFQLQETNFTPLALFVVVSYLSFSLAVSFSQDKYDCSLTPRWHRSSSWHCPYNCSCHTPGPPESGNGNGSSWKISRLDPKHHRYYVARQMRVPQVPKEQFRMV